MLAFATAPRYRNPWAPSPEDACPVNLADLMIEADMYVQNHATTSRLRVAMGLPATDPGLEQTMQELGLWPEGTSPMPVDIALVISRLPMRQRTAVNGRLAGLTLPEIAKQMGIVKGTVFVTLQGAARFLHQAAYAFKVLPDSDPQEPVGMATAAGVIGMGPAGMREYGRELGIEWQPHPTDHCRRACTGEEFILLWWDYIDAYCNGIRGR